MFLKHVSVDFYRSTQRHFTSAAAWRMRDEIAARPTALTTTDKCYAWVWRTVMHLSVAFMSDSYRSDLEAFRPLRLDMRMAQKSINAARHLCTLRKRHRIRFLSAFAATVTGRAEGVSTFAVDMAATGKNARAAHALTGRQTAMPPDRHPDMQIVFTVYMSTFTGRLEGLSTFTAAKALMGRSMR